MFQAMAVGRMEIKSGWMIFMRDISILPAFTSRCSSVSLAGTIQCKDFLAAMKQIIHALRKSTR